MGNPARHIGPGGAALVQKLLRNVFKGDDMPLFSFDDLHFKRADFVVGGKLDDCIFSAFVDQLGKFGGDVRQFLVEQKLAFLGNQCLGVRVDQADIPVL